MSVFGNMIYLFFLMAVGVCMFDTYRRGTKRELVVEGMIFIGMIIVKMVV